MEGNLSLVYNHIFTSTSKQEAEKDFWEIFDGTYYDTFN